MNLIRKSMFDKATIVIVKDNNILCLPAYQMLNCEKWPECLEDEDLPVLYRSDSYNINGKIVFWVEGYNAIPIIKRNDYCLVEEDFVYKALIESKSLDEEQIRLIDAGIDFLNTTIIEGGLCSIN